MNWWKTQFQSQKDLRCSTLSVFYVIHSFKILGEKINGFQCFMYDLNVVIDVAFCKPFFSAVVGI